MHIFVYIYIYRWISLPDGWIFLPANISTELHPCHPNPDLSISPQVQVKKVLKCRWTKKSAHAATLLGWRHDREGTTDSMVRTKIPQTTLQGGCTSCPELSFKTNFHHFFYSNDILNWRTSSWEGWEEMFPKFRQLYLLPGVFIYTYIYIHTNIHIYIYTYTHIHTHTNVCFILAFCWWWREIHSDHPHFLELMYIRCFQG